MKSILVATDGSEGAGRAVDFAAGLAVETGADLLIVYVTAEQGLEEVVMSQATRPQSAWIRETLAARAGEILRDARERARTKGCGSVQFESGEGDAAQVIIDIAEKTGPDLIVVGKRGNGRIRGLLIGSVSQKLVTIASNVVVVVP